MTDPEENLPVWERTRATRCIKPQLRTPTVVSKVQEAVQTDGPVTAVDADQSGRHHHNPVLPPPWPQKNQRERAGSSEDPSDEQQLASSASPDFTGSPTTGSALPEPDVTSPDGDMVGKVQHDITLDGDIAGQRVRFELPDEDETLLMKLKLAMRLFTAGEYAECAQSLQLTLGADKAVITPQQRLEIHCTLAKIFRHQQQAAPALQHFRQRLRLAQALENPKEICLAFGDTGLAYFQLAKSLRDTDNSDETETRFCELMNATIKDLQSQLVLADTLGRRDLLATAHHGLARAYEGLHSNDKVLEHVDQCSRLLDALPLEERLKIPGQLCQLLKAYGPDNKANFLRRLELLWRQAATAEELERPRVCGHVYHAIAKELETSGSFTDHYGPGKAMAFYRKSLEAYSHVPLNDLGSRGAKEVVDCTDRISHLESSCIIS